MPWFLSVIGKQIESCSEYLKDIHKINKNYFIFIRLSPSWKYSEVPIGQASYHHNENFMTHLTSFDTENIIATTEQKIVKLKLLRTFIHN